MKVLFFLSLWASGFVIIVRSHAEYQPWFHMFQLHSLPALFWYIVHFLFFFLHLYVIDFCLWVSVWYYHRMPLCNFPQTAISGFLPKGKHRGATAAHSTHKGVTGSLLELQTSSHINISCVAGASSWLSTAHSVGVAHRWCFMVHVYCVHVIFPRPSVRLLHVLILLFV